HHQPQQQQYTTKRRPGSSDEYPVIFKNNHGKPRPRPGYRPPSSATVTTPKSYMTAKPPYVTDFYPTPLSVKKPPITVPNIVGTRLKQPDNIEASLTVLDPPFLPNTFMQLPLNTTIIHKNLLVPMKEGRPKPQYPTARPSHNPVLPVLAGVSNWQTATSPWGSPPILMTTSSPHLFSNLSSGVSSVDDFKVTLPPAKNQVKIITSSKRPQQQQQQQHLSASASTVIN